MDTSEVERIRARVNGNITDAYSAQDDDAEEFVVKALAQARHDCRLLLAHLDAQQAIIDAAFEMREYITLRDVYTMDGRWRARRKRSSAGMTRWRR